jgi:hypothetical protein
LEDGIAGEPAMGDPETVTRAIKADHTTIENPRQSEAIFGKAKPSE